MFPSPSSVPSSCSRPSTAKGHDAASLDGGHPSCRPRPSSARAAPATGGPGACGSECSPTARCQRQRPPHTGISAIGRTVDLRTLYRQLDQATTAPAVRAPPLAQVDTDDDLLSARMPRCAPVEDRGPATNSTSGGHLPVPPHDDRRTTPSKERARPRGHGQRGQASWVCAPPPPGARRMPAYEEVALADETTAPRGTAHAASQRPYPLSRLVV